MILLFTVDHQRMDTSNTRHVVTDSREYLKAKFIFTSDWDGCVKTAIFSGTEKAYEVLLTGDECTVPHEVLGGRFGVSVFGINGDMRITTDTAYITVHKSGFAEGETPSDPTPTVYEQLLGGLTATADGLKQEIEDRKAADDTKADKATNRGFIGGSEARLNGVGGAAIGYKAQASLGGAAGNTSKADEGGAVGYGANTNHGGAVGKDAQSMHGGAVGRNAKTYHGAAIGDGAQTVNKNGRALSRNPLTVDGLNIKAGRNSDDAIVWKPDGEPLSSYSYVQIISTAAPGEAPTLSEVKTAVYVGATELNNGCFMDTDGNVMSGSDHTVGANGCAAYFENGVLTLGGKLTINEASKIGNTPIWGGISGNKGNKSLGIELLPNADITINTSKYSGIYGNYGPLYIYGDGKLTINISSTSHGGIVSYHKEQPENVNILNGANVTITGTPISDGAGIMFETVSGNKGEVIVSSGASLTVDVDGGAITAIQLGKGINETEGSAKFFDYTIMNADGTIPHERIPEGGVTTEKIADYAVTQAKIAANAISTSRLASGAVTKEKLGAELAAEIDGKAEQTALTAEAEARAAADAELEDSKADKIALGSYYTKTEADDLLEDKVDMSSLSSYYTKTETDTKIAEAQSLIPTRHVVDELPTENIDTNGTYWVPVDDPDEQNLYTEYAYINGAWEVIGNPQKVDLSDYYTKTDVDGKLSQYSTKTEVNALSLTVTALQDEVDDKADAADVYTKSETNTRLAQKADASAVTSIETDIDELQADVVSAQADITALQTDKADKPVITSVSAASPSVTLTDNTEARCGAVTLLTLTLPSSTGDDYISAVIFTANSNTPLSYPDTIVMMGTDCIDGVFAPVSGKRYEVIVTNDGASYVGRVSGYEVTA